MVVRLPIALFFTISTAVCAANPAELSADEIMQLATAASGGDAWLKAETNLMTGKATLYRGGKAMVADRYEMRRVYPTKLSEAIAKCSSDRISRNHSPARVFCDKNQRGRSRYNVF